MEKVSLTAGPPTAINVRKTHCANGHEFNGENLKVWVSKKSGRTMRYCAICRRADASRHYKKRKEGDALCLVIS